MSFATPRMGSRKRGWGHGADASCGRRSGFVRLAQGTRRFRAAAAARVTSPLLVHARAGARANGEAGPQGRRAGCPESRRSNQEETTPRWRALQASCLPGARAGYGVFRRDSCPDEKLAGIHAGHPAGFPSPTRRAIGAPGRAARSQRAEATAKAKAASLRRSGFGFWRARCAPALVGPLGGGEAGTIRPHSGRQAGACS